MLAFPPVSAVLGYPTNKRGFRSAMGQGLAREEAKRRNGGKKRRGSELASSEEHCSEGAMWGHRSEMTMSLQRETRAGQHLLGMIRSTRYDQQHDNLKGCKKPRNMGRDQASHPSVDFGYN
jgi:hypothetical protein